MDPNVLIPIFKADYWVFDDTVPWRFTRASEELLHSFDHNHDREIVFLSKRGSQQIIERTGGVRFSRLDTGGSSAAKKAFIAQRQAYGQSVVYFGDCKRESVLAATADIAVTVADAQHRVNAEAPIVFLSPDLEKFGSLHSLCAKRNVKVKSAVAVATIPNVVAIAAAVFLNSPALVSVLMTTLRGNYLLSAGISASATSRRLDGTYPEGPARNASRSDAGGDSRTQPGGLTPGLNPHRDPP